MKQRTSDKRPVASIISAPSNFLRRLKDHLHRTAELLPLLLKQQRRTEHRCRMEVMTAGVHFARTS